MAAGINKSTSARTYSRHLKPKDEIILSSSGEIPVEYENACRLCLEKADIMLDMFRFQDSLIPIVEKIKSIVPLEIDEDDEMTKLVCDRCLMQLNYAFNFKKRCLASDAKLRQFLFNKCLPKSSFYCKTDEWNNEDDICLVDESYSVDVKKDSCTIDWNDEVPLAAMIENMPIEKVENLPGEKVQNNEKQSCQVDEPGTDEFGMQHEDIDDNDGSDGLTDPVDSYEDLTNEKKQPLPQEEQSHDFKKPVKKKKFSKFSSKPPMVITIGNPRKLPPKPTSVAEETVKQHPNPDASSKRVLKVVEVEDVPLAARLNVEKCDDADQPETVILEKGKESNQPESVILNKPDKKSKHTCRKCKICLDTKEQLLAHRGNCALEYICPFCSRAFLSRSLMDRHLRVHTGERPYMCEICDSSFSQKEGLIRHKMQLHLKDKPYICTICNKGFGIYRLLLSHYKLTHGDRQVYSCVRCPKVFKHPSGLSRHKEFHNGTKYSCKICLRSFSDGSAARRHFQMYHFNTEKSIKMIEKLM